VKLKRKKETETMLSFCIIMLVITIMSLLFRRVDSESLHRRLPSYPPPNCYIEEGFDYVNNDIGNATVKTAEECCALCYWKPGCRAFSWNNYNDGTCWFKSGRGTVVVNPGVRSALTFPYPGPASCITEDNIDYVGNDIGNVPMLKPLSCCSACQNFPGCRAFSFTTFNGGTCWLKSGKGKLVIKQGVSSAEIYREPADPQCAMQPGVDFLGNDIGSGPSAKPEGCCDVCKNFKGCRVFSWTNYNGGTCWLKNLLLDSVASPNVTSSVVFSNPPAPSCALEVGVDYIDNDIGNVPSKDAYGCCSLCMARDGCKAFSWSNYNGGTCWLKSAKGTTVANPNVQSAVV
jgi:hypothetical protein